MLIRLNGKMREVPERVSIRQLLDELGLHPMRVAVQQNEGIIKRDRYGEVVLQPGDAVEILTIMGIVRITETSKIFLMVFGFWNIKAMKKKDLEFK